jgi:hypothetical protein
LQSMGLEGRALVPLQSFQPLASCRCSVIKLELCACACEPALGHSLAFCWDHIKASTHTKQLDNCLQKNAYFSAYYFAYFAYCFAYFAYCFAYCSILFDIFCIFCILQYAEYAESEHCTIFLHIILHIVHIILHIYPTICKIICKLQNQYVE